MLVYFHYRVRDPQSDWIITSFIIYSIVPVLILNLFVLAISLQNKTLLAICNFPSLIFSGNFSLFLFGPVCWSICGCREDKDKNLVLSRHLTCANILLSLLQASYPVWQLSNDKPSVKLPYPIALEMYTHSLRNLILISLLTSITLTVAVLWLVRNDHLGCMEACNPQAQLVLTPSGVFQQEGTRSNGPPPQINGDNEEASDLEQDEVAERINSYCENQNQGGSPQEHLQGGDPTTEEWTSSTEEGTPASEEGTPPTEEGTSPTEEGNPVTPPTQKGIPPIEVIV